MDRSQNPPIGRRVLCALGVALVGLSGAGKTTLVSLIGRFYQPTAGRVLIDGTDIRRSSRSCGVGSTRRSALPAQAYRAASGNESASLARS
jgi:ABC-type oligopeptide transport system ATPase subunit